MNRMYSMVGSLLILFLSGLTAVAQPAVPTETTCPCKPPLVPEHYRVFPLIDEHGGLLGFDAVDESLADPMVLSFQFHYDSEGHLFQTDLLTTLESDYPTEGYVATERWLFSYGLFGIETVTYLRYDEDGHEAFSCTCVRDEG